MLIRIVKMTFQPEKTDDFLEMFNEIKDKIRNFKGCEHLELMQDYDNPNSFSTYSKWQDDYALNAYRDSALFDLVWKQTKAMFSERPIAFSLKTYVKVD